MMTRTRTPGRGWAYTGVTLGGAVSIAANITHTFVPPAGHPAGWTPAPMAVVFATSWPVFLFVAIEILARTPWPRLWNWTLLRWLGLTPVALVAAFVSYRHLSGLLAHYGEEPLAALAGPLAVDGLMVVATGALLATGRHHTTNTETQTETQTETEATPVARRTDAPTTPAAPTIQPSIPDSSAVPSIIGPASTSNPSPSPVDSDPTGPTGPAATPEPVPAKAVTPEVPTPAELAARITTPRPTPAASPAVDRPAARTTHRPTPTSPSTPAPRLASSTTDTPVTASDAAQLTLPVVPPDLLARAAKVARQYRTEHGTPITPGQLAVRLQVSSEEASQALAVLDLDGNDRTNPTTPVPTVNGNRPNGSRQSTTATPKATR
jgi:hypothetical protein